MDVYKEHLLIWQVWNKSSSQCRGKCVVCKLIDKWEWIVGVCIISASWRLGQRAVRGRPSSRPARPGRYICLHHQLVKCPRHSVRQCIVSACGLGAAVIDRRAPAADIFLGTRRDLAAEWLTDARPTPDGIQTPHDAEPSRARMTCWACNVEDMIPSSGWQLTRRDGPVLISAFR